AIAGTHRAPIARKSNAQTDFEFMIAASGVRLVRLDDEEDCVLTACRSPAAARRAICGWKIQRLGVAADIDRSGGTHGDCHADAGSGVIVRLVLVSSCPVQ